MKRNKSILIVTALAGIAISLTLSQSNLLAECHSFPNLVGLCGPPSSNHPHAACKDGDDLPQAHGNQSGQDGAFCEGSKSCTGTDTPDEIVSTWQNQGCKPDNSPASCCTITTKNSCTTTTKYNCNTALMATCTVYMTPAGVGYSWTGNKNVCKTIQNGQPVTAGDTINTTSSTGCTNK